MSAWLSVIGSFLSLVLAWASARGKAAADKTAGDARDAHRLTASEEQENRAQDIRLKLRAARSKRLPEQQ